MRTLALSGSSLGRAIAVASVSATVALLAGCGGSDSGDSGNSGGGGNAITASTDGAQIFKAANCSSCHTLAAAGAKGQIGPNLDEEKPDAGEVKEYVTNGEGSMPSFSKRLSAEQIQAVSDYVAEAAGR